MTKEMALLLVEASENAGNEAEIREDYSGRCMYGQTTTAVVVDSATQLLADFIQYVSENIGEYTHENPTEGDDDITVPEWTGAKIPDPENFRMDNLGTRTIIY